MTWVLTRNGVEFDLVNPTPDMVRLDDIAFSLARIRRFNGHTQQNCSTALHSVIVSEFLANLGYDKNMQRWGLLHDAHEAYIGDIASPVKWAMESGNLPFLQGGIDSVIYEKFKINRSIGKNWIEYADLCALRYEREHFMPASSTVWPPFKNGDIPLMEVDEHFRKVYDHQHPTLHEELFLDKARELGLT